MTGRTNNSTCRSRHTTASEKPGTILFLAAELPVTGLESSAHAGPFEIGDRNATIALPLPTKSPDCVVPRLIVNAFVDLGSTFKRLPA